MRPVIIAQFRGKGTVRVIRRILLAIMLVMPAILSGAEFSNTGLAGSPVSTKANIISWTRGTKISSLAGRPDSDIVEFDSSHSARVGDLRRLDTAARKMRAAAPAKSLPSGLNTQPAASGTPVTDAADLAAAFKENPNETVQLPSGQRATVGLLRFLQPEIEKRLGRRISETPQQAARTGPAIKLARNISKDEWNKLLEKPDNTLLESPSGKRITVGEIKQELTKSRQHASPNPAAGARP